MRYYTKEWYIARQHQDITNDIKSIEDKNYTNEEINKIYEEELEKCLKQAQEEYNEEPFWAITEEDIVDKDFCPEDWISFDEKTGELIEPHSAEEARKLLKKEIDLAKKEFEEKEKFDRQNYVKQYELAYQKKIANFSSMLPAWVSRMVDSRLIGLSLLPKSVLKKLKEEEVKNRSFIQNVEKKVLIEKSKAEKIIPESIRDIFDEMRGKIILGIRKVKNNIEIIVTCSDDLYMNEIIENGLKCECITFKNCKKIDIEDGIMLYRGCNMRYLQDELYKKGDDYEFHLLIYAEDLKYLSIECVNIEKFVIEYLGVKKGK